MQLKIVYLPPKKLKPYEKNARKHAPADIEQIKKSIQMDGFNDPIGIWGKENLIVEGHGRQIAAIELGLDTVPCIRLDHMTDEQRRDYAIRHNRTAELSEWDFSLLQQEIAELEIQGFDMGSLDFDFNLEDVDAGGATEYSIVEDEPPEPPETPIAKLGDIWQLGNHRLMCGDSTDVNAVDKLMDGHKADMVLTDPPYGMKLDTDFSTIRGSLKSIGRKNHTSGNKYKAVIGDNEDFTEDLINTVFSCCDCEEMFLFGADYYAELLPDKNNGSWLVWDKRKESQADAIGSEFELIWSRNKHKRRMLRHDWFGFLSSENQADARNRVHPTQKPISLLVDIMNQWGNGKDNIVDLYGGSGSTLIACEQTGRTCYMMELDPHYCDVIVKRWENLTGRKAVLLNG